MLRKKGRRKLLAQGLGQIPGDGLERLQAALADPGVPVLLTGEIWLEGKGG